MVVTQKRGEPIKEEIRKMPVSEVSENIFIEKVRKVEGDVLFLNSELFPHLPINIKEMSLFVDRDGKNATLELARLPEHGRSLFSKTKLFFDIYKNTYEYVDIKGVGLPEKGPHGRPETIEYLGSIDVMGLFTLEEAEKDLQISNSFLKNGEKAPSSSAAIAIIELKSAILASGEKVSIEELKRRGIIPREIVIEDKIVEYRPVIYLRAFSEVMRLPDAQTEDFERFANRHGMDIHGYVNWWVGEVAKNLAKMHNLGKAHTNLKTIQNFTLDGRIVDFDTVKPAKLDLILDDVDRTLLAICHLPTINNLISKKENWTLFLEKYLENRTDIGKEEFKSIRSKFDSSLTEEGMKRLEFLFEKKFGEKLA